MVILSSEFFINLSCHSTSIPISTNVTQGIFRSSDERKRNVRDPLSNSDGDLYILERCILRYFL